MEIKIDKLMSGFRIKQIREDHKLSVKDFASSLNLKSRTIENWEKGRSLPSLRNLVNLCNLYQASMSFALVYEVIK